MVTAELWPSASAMRSSLVAALLVVCTCAQQRSLATHREHGRTHDGRAHDGRAAHDGRTHAARAPASSDSLSFSQRMDAAVPPSRTISAKATADREEPWLASAPSRSSDAAACQVLDEQFPLTPSWDRWLQPRDTAEMRSRDTAEMQPSCPAKTIAWGEKIHTRRPARNARTRLGVDELLISY